MRKSRAEQETIIRRAADEQTWDVFSEDQRVIRVLEARHGPGLPHGSGFRWVLGAPCVSFHRQRAKLSEEQRKEAADRLARYAAREKERKRKADYRGRSADSEDSQQCQPRQPESAGE